MDILIAYFGGILTGIVGVVLWASLVASVPTVPGAHAEDGLRPASEEDDGGGDDDDPDGEWSMSPEDQETILRWE